MPSSQQESPHVLIIGAGVCGLAIAQGLRQAKIPFTIFEAEVDHARRSREWTMVLHWGTPMLESLLPPELAARLRVDAVVDKNIDWDAYPNNGARIFNAETGELVKEITAKGALRVSRRKLRALCAEGIDVKYGHTLEKVTYGSKDNDDNTVTASFTNGAAYTGTILVGSDGPRSYVREHLFGAEKAKRTDMDIEYFNVSFKYPDENVPLMVRKQHPVMSLATHRDCMVLISVHDVPDPERPETWRFQVQVQWLKDGNKSLSTQTMSNAELHKMVKQKAANLTEPYRSVVLQMPDDVQIHILTLGYWAPVPWDTCGGRVTLAGDAAHPMPPNRGQGLNNAVNDAYAFVDAVKKLSTGDGNQAELVNAYSDEVVERGANEVRLSSETAYLFLNPQTMAESGLIKYGLTRKPEQ